LKLTCIGGVKRVHRQCLEGKPGPQGKGWEVGGVLETTLLSKAPERTKKESKYTLNLS
jgi:hypothetical protein